MKLKKDDRVQVQLGPNIEEATIERVGQMNRYTVKCADGNLISVSGDQIIPLPEATEAVPEVKANAAVVASAMAAPPLDREMPEEEASAYVINDEWYGQIEQGDPFKEAAEPYEKANPDRKFRYLGDTTVKRHGKRGYQEVIDKKTSLPVKVSGMTLASIPMHVHEERARRVAKLTDDQAASKQEPIREVLAEAGKEMGIGSAALDAFDTARTLRQGMSGDQFRK